jgi:hypothetical protein
MSGVQWLSIDCGHRDNEGKSAVSFCRQVASWVKDMVRNFYLVKNHKIANNSTTTKAREKSKHRFGILRISEISRCMFDKVLETIKFFPIKLKNDNQTIYWMKDPH